MERDIVSVLDMKDDFEAVLADAVKMKKEPPKKGREDPLKGKVLGMVFEKPSLRTRTSFEVDMHKLGGEGTLHRPGLGKPSSDAPS